MLGWREVILLEKVVSGGDFMGKRGCGSKPFASRLSRFPVVFVGCVVFSLLSLLDFGRRLLLSLLDFGRRPFSRFAVVFMSCITTFICSLSDFGRRLCSQFASLSDFGRRLRCLSGFGRRLCREVIWSFVGVWGPSLFSFPFSFSPMLSFVSLLPFSLECYNPFSQLLVLVWVEL